MNSFDSIQDKIIINSIPNCNNKYNNIVMIVNKKYIYVYMYIYDKKVE